MLGVILSLLILSGCYYDEAEEVLPPDGAVSFAADIQPIFNNHCIACHPVLGPPDLTEGNAYEAITNGVYIIPEDIGSSLLYQRLVGNPSIMPPSGSLPSSEIELLKAWIEQGALQN